MNMNTGGKLISGASIACHRQMWVIRSYPSSPEPPGKMPRILLSVASNIRYARPLLRAYL